ncbi:MAG: 2-succinyl-6-hydroxy-2,4-cyclohexadiene-1-carboxylate synthase [Coriobacteriaceae bacterium]|jgi:2-succinyl-6-hydroxy-2,4-cyclohexadiene-1-carboxylate synthase|nr:2-succinyl-6-hydroxy-2,4-cyclohexadiene-1-carboxylate synthase [Coriobacteriaceae bacterium]
MAIFSYKGIHYHVAQWGSKENPPLVLLHGFTQSAQTWEAVAQELAQTRFVIAPDFVGHGKSDRPTEPASYEMGAVLESLAALLRWYWIERADVLGYSMGGRIALAFAIARPHRVASLVLESAGLGPSTVEQHEAMLRRDFALIEKLLEGDIEAFMDEWEAQPVFDSQRRLPEEARRRLRAQRCANDTHALALSIRGTGQHTMPDLSARMGGLPMPVLYIAGILDRRYLRIAEKLQHLPGISCVLLNAGHNTHLEAPEAFCRQVRSFLEESPLSGKQTPRPARLDAT